MCSSDLTTCPPSPPKLKVFHPERVSPSNNLMDSGIFGSFLDGALFDEHEIEIKIMHHRVIVVSLNIPVEHFLKLWFLN